ncbi:MAG: glycosyltransferase family 2 protein [Ignavibacteria bacterium]|nr:glycosyltransferase family 2 protein [Ignavibacteria bacterium]
MIDISVIIITWNSENEIAACVDSLINNSPNLNIELIIIDNNSADNSFSIINKISYSRIQTYRNPENLGYTKAVNQGIKYSKGKYILLLNPDTMLKEGCLAIMFLFLEENSDYGACAPLMLNPDSTVQLSVRCFPTYWTMFCEFTLLAYIFPKSQLFGKWKMKYFDYTKDADVSQPMAAAFMTGRQALEETGNMDERFEMFFNDVDMCKKIIDSGKKIRLLTSAAVVHEHGLSVHKDRVRMIKIWNKDCYKYFEKYHKNTLLLIWLKINLIISGFVRTIFR